MTTTPHPLYWLRQALELSYTAEESNTEWVDDP
jgi:hypothetical protein